MRSDKGYLLPVTIDPLEAVCIRVYVPNDPLYIAAFWGSYEYLANWLAWERDNQKRGKDAAAVWREWFELSRQQWLLSSGECGIMDVRQNPTAPCILEKQDSAESAWEQFADMRLCAPKMRIYNGVLQQDTTGNGDWVDAGDPALPYDERTDGTVTPAWETPPVGESGACLAAMNAAEYLYTRVQEIAIANRDYIDFLQWFGVLVAGVSLLLGVGVILVILAAVLSVAVGEFAGSWDDVLLYDFRAELTCILYLRYQEDGTMDSDDWSMAQAAILALRDGKSYDYQKIALMLAKIVLWSLGPVGMSRVANVAGIVEGTCTDDCGWQHEFDFTSGLNGWEFETVDGRDKGHYEEGVGLLGVYTGSMGTTGNYGVHIIHPAFDDTEITGTTYYVTYDEDENYYSRRRFDVKNGLTVVATMYNDQIYNPPGPLHPNGWAGGYDTGTGDNLYMLLDRIHLGLPTPTPGDIGGIILSKVVVFGTGVNPFI